MFLKRKVRCAVITISFIIFPQLIVIHTVNGFGIVNKAEIDVFLELSCFFNDPVDVGNLVSGSPGESQGRGSLVGCRPWGRIESDTTEAT